MKKFALKGLVVLFVVIILCMFFAKTIQTITTAKVQVVHGQTSRFEDKMTFLAQIYFPEIEEYAVDDAQKSPITVDKVFVKEGHWVEKGETIFTAKLTTFEADMQKLRDDFDKKAKDMIDLDIPNRKLSKQSAQNDLYDSMLDAQDALSGAMFSARSEALKDNVLLPGNVTTWEKHLNSLTDLSDSAQTAILKAVAMKKTFNDNRTAFFDSYENKKIKISPDTFAYINSRNTLIKDMDDLSEQMTLLDSRLRELSRVTAPQTGYIVTLGVTAGDSYDGVKACFTMNKEGTLPLLRADMAGQKRIIENGTRVDVPVNEYTNERTQVIETVLAADGTKALLMALPESMMVDKSFSVRNLISQGGVNVTITYRAKQSSTLLPASCVRSDGDTHYVYLVERTYGGFLGGTGMTVKKMTVTAIEKSDKVYSISEALDYQEIADREDRPLEDGKAVMNYVD